MPPHKLKEMQKDITDPSSDAYQRLRWDALRKSINGLINKVPALLSSWYCWRCSPGWQVNTTNIKELIPELFAENLIRGRGLVCTHTHPWLLIIRV